jgi:hypothetical protein
MGICSAFPQLDVKFYCMMLHEIIIFLMKELAVLVFMKGNIASVSSLSPLSLVNYFSNLILFIFNGKVLHYLTFKINPYQHGFTRPESTIANLITSWLYYFIVRLSTAT